MTLLYVVLSIFPIIDVESSWVYSLKIAGMVLGANFLGWMIYRQGGGRRTYHCLSFSRIPILAKSPQFR